MRAEEARHLLEGLRLADEIALHLVAAQEPQILRLLVVFDALPMQRIEYRLGVPSERSSGSAGYGRPYCGS